MIGRQVPGRAFSIGLDHRAPLMPSFMRKLWEEREEGWANGPVNRDTLQGSSLVSRRFGLRQGEKTRLVDGLSFLVGSTI